MKKPTPLYNSANRHPTDPPPLISHGTRDWQIVKYLYEHEGERFNIRAYSLKTGISRSSIYEILNRLIRKEIIIKHGAGDYKLSSTGNACVGSVQITMRHPTPFIIAQSDTLEVRGHGFRFLVKLPKNRDWVKRRGFMQRSQIGFKAIPHGETVILRGHRVKLYNKSLDIYFAKGWSSYADTADNSWKNAIKELKLILSDFQKKFSFKLDRVEWRVCKQHYSLIKNALAKDYLKNREKLHVWAEDGKLWMLIDNSLNLEECETVHTQSARSDNQKVQDFFNGVKQTGITPEFIMGGFDNLIKDRQYYAENLRQHTDAIKTLDKQIQRLGDILDKKTRKKR